jgi:hypothetical protein
MDPTTLAATLAGAQMSRVQMAIAAEMMRMNTDSADSVAKVIAAAEQNMSSPADVAVGLGQNLDISI